MQIELALSSFLSNAVTGDRHARVRTFLTAGMFDEQSRGIRPPCSFAAPVHDMLGESGIGLGQVGMILARDSLL